MIIENNDTIICPKCLVVHARSPCPKCGTPGNKTQFPLFDETARVGVLLFDRSRTATRDGRTSSAFDRFPHTGLRKVLSGLNEPFCFCTLANADDFEYLLIPCHSFMDIMDIIEFVPRERRAIVVIGGPATMNVRSLLSHVDIANFGRCDGGKINRILDGESMPSVWRRSSDPRFENEYFVDHATSSDLGEEEVSVGCGKRCFFCHYSWWNGPTQMSKSYTSGFRGYEDFIQALNWEKAKRGAVTSIDGQTESIRKAVGKNITTRDICEALKRSDNVADVTGALRVKIYTIAGFPGETERASVECDLIDCAADVDADLSNKITIKLSVSHFIPFQKTPLWWMPFNPVNLRPAALEKIFLFKGRHISLWSTGMHTPTPCRAAISAILQRARNIDSDRILSLIKAHPLKQTKLATSVLPELISSFGDLLGEQETPAVGNIQTGNEIRAASAEKTARTLWSAHLRANAGRFPA